MVPDELGVALLQSDAASQQRIVTPSIAVLGVWIKSSQNAGCLPRPGLQYQQIHYGGAIKFGFNEDALQFTPAVASDRRLIGPDSNAPVFRLLITEMEEM
ncbi:hypothetical protein EYF80_048290 [Liparis tanakae]|uniref:Uncharacterized protein n=1 Tax=Liparis tanakae TaxID=230148 RepID=A0A4Z2FK63_9TELE|nr:hypothetical protein EYF80_048290 [Liparis tanakae]